MVKRNRKLRKEYKDMMVDKIMIRKEYMVGKATKKKVVIRNEIRTS
jgi:hypothetical protein